VSSKIGELFATESAVRKRAFEWFEVGMALVLVCCQVFAFGERFRALIALKWMLGISY